MEQENWKSSYSIPGKPFTEEKLEETVAIMSRCIDKRTNVHSQFSS